MADRWTDYEQEVGGRVEVDRDFDGVRDGFYTYDNGTLAYEEHDTNNDGVIDRRVEYVARLRTLELEDRDFNGSMDFKTLYDEREIPIRTELDTNEDGQTDVWEFYEGNDAAHILLVRKEEDINADGEVDVTSHYSEGKLVRKEISDPELYQSSKVLIQLPLALVTRGVSHSISTIIDPALLAAHGGRSPSILPLAV